LKGWFGRKKRAKALSAKSASSMGKVVYGWLPYWATSSQMDQFQWDRLTHVAYFSYEVNSANGGCSGKHSWGSAIVQKAHDHGVKIHLTATLFGSSGNKALLQNETSCNTLVSGLVSAVTGAGGDGICIDFESVGSWTGATKALTAFMTKLAAAAKAQGLEVAIALPSIDWYADFDVGSFEKLGIMSIIMGYDYHYSGSSVPGPVAPLYPSSRWGSQLNDDYSVRYYLGKMTNAANLYLAVPYYGRKWKAKSTALGASSLGSSYSSSPVLSTCASSAASHGRKWDSDGSVPYFAYTDSDGAAWQCFYDDVESLGLKYDYINSKGLGGVGIWALSHEPGTAKFWNLLNEKFGASSGGGGGGTVEDGSASVVWNFSGSEGWAQNTSNFSGTTNVAGEAWVLNAARVYPAATYGTATGDLWLDVPGSYAVTPAVKGMVATQAVLTVRAAANSNLSGRKVGVYYSTDGGTTWTKAGTASATAYDSLVPTAVAIPEAGGGEEGVRFKLLDESTDQDKGTVLVYQMAVKGRDATLGTLTVTLSPASATWSVNGTTYASGDSVVLAAGTYTVVFNALAGYVTPASKTVSVVAGGTRSVSATYAESQDWTRTIEFAASDGWSAKTDALFAGTTNVAGEAWSAKGLKVNPTVNSHGNVGYALLDATDDYLVTPALQGTVTEVSGIIRAGGNSNLANRHLKVQYSLGGGTWQDLATWTADSYSDTVGASKSCSLSHAGGVRLRFYDAGTVDTSKTTVVLHRLVLKGTKTVTAPKAGWLKATLTPSNAKWNAAGTNHNSGTAVKLAAGTYTVGFNALSGYVAPADRTVTVAEGQTNAITAGYTQLPGALTVTLEPAAAAAGATWKVAGTNHAGGATVNLAPGTYTVSFNALEGYTKPANQSVTVAAGEAASLTGTYAWNPATLTVNLNPAAVRESGRWVVDGTAHAHGESVELGAGTHSVSFAAVEGWDAPAATNVALSAGGSKTVTGTYTVHGAWELACGFTEDEGWTERSSAVYGLATNAAGGTWTLSGVKIFPTYATNNETGYAVLQQTGDWVELPPFAGSVTQVTAKVRAGADSGLDARKMKLQYNLGQGWVDWGTWSCTSYTSVLNRSKSGTIGGGAAGTRLRVLDAGTGDVSKSTVVLHAITVRGTSDAGSASTGSLTVNLTPETATWSVGGAAYASGATAEVVAGNYEVSFHAPEGWDAPAASNVTVAVGASKTLKAACAARPGTLSVTLEPAAVQGSATWKAAGTNYASGATATLAAGTYTVSFGAVDGYVTPDSRSVEVPPGGAASAGAVYEVKPGSLKVTLDPAEGMWKVAGTNHASGTTAKLAPGTYAVTFGAQTGYATPAERSVTLAAGGSKSMTVRYEGLPGSVTYALEPEGGTWKINGTNYASGAVADVPSGTWTVTFGALSGYTVPESQSIEVEADGLYEGSAEYAVKPVPLTVKFNPEDVRASARWSVAGVEGSYTNAAKVPLEPGTWTVTCSEVAGWTAPAATNVTLNVGASSKTVTLAYKVAPGRVTCTLEPSGATWTIGGETYAGGATAEVEAGTYEVVFGEVAGYETPAAQSVTVGAGETVSLSVAYEALPEGPDAPVLAAATGVTTGAFAIAWSAVDGATGYTVQVAESGTFDDGVALRADFADGALPEGWMAKSVTFATNKAKFSGDGTGVAVFTGSGKWLMTPRLARPGIVGWSHALNTGTTSTNPWTYVVECSAETNFEDVVWSETLTAPAGTTSPAPENVDLTGLRGVYVRWRDARASGTAQRYVSDITALDGLVAGRDTAATGASFDGLAAGTTYYVRVRATTADGTGDWSAVRTVRTADPPEPPAAPVLGEAADVSESGFSIAWGAVAGAGIYHVQVADSAAFDDEPVLACDFTGELPAGWETTGELVAETSYAAGGAGAIRFKAAGKYLRTPLVANPGTLRWHHATASSNEWSYALQASYTSDFSTPIPVQSVTVTQKLATAVEMTANLRYWKNVYMRWVDTRPSGSAQRYISGVSLTAEPVDDTTTSGTSRSVSGLAAGTTYYVRVRAWGEGGWSGWSAAKSVTTAGGGGGTPFDPFDPPANPDLQPPVGGWEIGGRFRDGGKVELDWSGVTGAKGYIVFFSTNLAAGEWKALDTNAVSGGTAEPTNAPVFYRLRAW